MAATPPATLIDVVVLVFARSELKNLVGTDALRTVLTGDRNLFPSPGTMSLQPVWELIESQPGFDAEQAVPPMCRLKCWEGQLKVKVEMPGPLAELDLATREKKAMECNVGDDDLNKVLKPAAAPAPKKDVARVIESSTGPAPQAGSNNKVKIAIAAALLGVVAAGVSIYLTVGRDDSDTVKVSEGDLSGEVPLTNIRRNGKFMVATLGDAKWRTKPEFERRRQLEALAPKVRVQQAAGLTVMDDKGLVIATLKLDRNPMVTFPRR